MLSAIDAVMTAVRCALAIILLLVASGFAQAQVVHRRNVPAGDATPQGGSFSIHFPVPFNDIEVSADDPQATTAKLYILAGADGDQIRLSATEAPMAGMQPRPLESFMSGIGEKSGGTVTDIHRDTSGGQETLSFALNVTDGGYYFHVVRVNNVQYMQVVQFRESVRDKAAKMKDDFFNSFKLNTP